MPLGDVYIVALGEGANSSPLSDGASALLLADSTGLARLDREPLARIAASGMDGEDPHLFGIGPVRAVQRAPKR